MLLHKESDSLCSSIPGIWDKMFQFGEKHAGRSKNEGEIWLISQKMRENPPQKKIVKRSYLLLNLELGAFLWAVGSPYIYLQTILATFGPKTIFQHNIFSRGQTHSIASEADIFIEVRFFITFEKIPSLSINTVYEKESFTIGWVG